MSSFFILRVGEREKGIKLFFRLDQTLIPTRQKKESVCRRSLLFVVHSFSALLPMEALGCLIIVHRQCSLHFGSHSREAYRYAVTFSLANPFLPSFLFFHERSLCTHLHTLHTPPRPGPYLPKKSIYTPPLYVFRSSFFSCSERRPCWPIVSRGRKNVSPQPYPCALG